MKLTLALFFALGWEHLVADTNLDVVSLSGEDQQRFVLSLPPKAGDRSIVAVSVLRSVGVKGLNQIEPTASYADGFGASENPTCLMIHVIDDCLVVDLLDQAGPKSWRWNSENDIFAIELLLEIFLLQNATVCTIKSRDGEYRMHPSIVRLSRHIKMLLETSFSDRPLR